MATIPWSQVELIQRLANCTFLDQFRPAEQQTFRAILDKGKGEGALGLPRNVSPRRKLLCQNGQSKASRTLGSGPQLSIPGYGVPGVGPMATGFSEFGCDRAKHLLEAVRTFGADAQRHVIGEKVVQFVNLVFEREITKADVDGC